MAHEKIEDSDFDSLIKRLYSFLDDANRKKGVGDSKISSYSYTHTSSDPHNVPNGYSNIENTAITNNPYSSALNVIKNIISNNYMKTNNITISNGYYEANSHNLIPDLTNYDNLVKYWNDNGANACNGACVGYCKGSCYGGNKNGDTGSRLYNTKSGCNNACNSACDSNCSGSCASQTRGASLVTIVICLNCNGACNGGCEGCTAQCKGGCGLSCSGTCEWNCGGCYSNCNGKCSGECYGCYSVCGSGCEGECGKTCGSKCGSTCGGTCMFGSNSKPIAGGKNKSS